MATCHRPDLAAFKVICRLQDSSEWDEAKHRDPFMWPSINQEDLSKPRPLLLLLNSRGRHPPCDFAGADCEALHLGKSTNAIIPIVVRQGLMILNGAKKAEDYGRVLSWLEHPEAYYDLVKTRKQFLPEEGFTILEVQERLLSFLVECCYQILHDIPKDIMTSDKYPITPQPQLTTEAETTGFDSLAVLMAEAPYRAPAQLDLERIEALLSARRSAAEDHVWSLREDPGYFSEVHQELAEHRIEMVKDASGKAHPDLGKTQKGVFWARVSRTVFFDAYYESEMFTELEKQARNLGALQKKYAAVISPSEDLPQDYLRAILKFRCSLRGAFEPPLAQLRSHVAASPPFRKLFYCTKSKSSPSRWVVKEKKVKVTKFEERLLALLELLWADAPELHVKLPDVLDELERLRVSNPDARELLSPYIVRIIGDISIVSQCYRQIENYEPWARGFENAKRGYAGSIDREVESEVEPWFIKLGAFSNEANMIYATKLSDVSEGKLPYPIDKRRTKENVEIMRRSEAKLDKFWAIVDETIQSAMGTTPDGSAHLPLFSQPRVIQRTPEWVEPVNQPKGQASGPTTNTDSEAIYKPMSTLYIGPSNSKAEDVESEAPKVKTKTRGTTDTSLSSSSDKASADADPSDPHPIFLVDARTLKVIRTIFHDPSAAAPQGELPWQDFLHALTSVGFTAEKLYGSVWQFRPVSLDIDRSIQFHEPHPRNKVPFRVARRHGRRLCKAYGWNAEMFALKEK